MRAAALGMTLLALAALLTACRDSRPAPPAVASAPPASGAARDVRIDAGGISLAARVYGRMTDSGVVLVPDTGRGIAAWEATARDLAATGLVVLAYDAPGHGGSPRPNGPIRETAVVGAAVAYLRSHGVDRVALVGEGRGGAAVLLAATRDPVTAVVAISVNDALDQSEGELLAAVASLQIPVLLMSSLGESQQVAAARRLYDAAREPRTLVLVPGTGRGADLLAGAASIAARDVLRDFLRSAFAPRAA